MAIRAVENGKRTRKTFMKELKRAIKINGKTCTQKKHIHISRNSSIKIRLKLIFYTFIRLYDDCTGQLKFALNYHPKYYQLIELSEEEIRDLCPNVNTLANNEKNCF